MESFPNVYVLRGSIILAKESCSSHVHHFAYSSKTGFSMEFHSAASVICKHSTILVSVGCYSVTLKLVLFTVLGSSEGKGKRLDAPFDELSQANWA